MDSEDAPNAASYARQLLCHVTGKRLEQVLADSEMYASEAICEAMEAAVRRLLSGEPLAYILGKWEFYGLQLIVNENVLIPRDDTCAVTALAIDHALFLDQAPRVLDLCTGSGCIGLAIASRVADARVTLADISPDALTVAKKNATLNHLTGRVSCVVSDALSAPSPFLGKYDLIVSNPPYITTAALSSLDEEVKREPSLALDGGEDGLVFYKTLLSFYSPALFLFEIGFDQGGAVSDLGQEKGYRATVKKDLGGNDRLVILEKD